MLGIRRCGQIGAAGTLLVDLNWVASEFKTAPLLAGSDHRLAKCGLLVSVPCTDAGGTEIPGRDRYFCGDDLIMCDIFYFWWFWGVIWVDLPLPFVRVCQPPPAPLSLAPRAVVYFVPTSCPF